MGKERFKRVKLNELIRWQRFTHKLLEYYKGKAREGERVLERGVLFSVSG